jgi:hypothetical protein
MFEVKLKLSPAQVTAVIGLLSRIVTLLTVIVLSSG